MRILGKTNIYVNEIGCGGIPIQHVDQNVVNEMIDEMIKQKINFIDTARGYTVSEELLGIALEGKREKFVLATKSMSRTYEGMKQDIETSLKNLKTDYIDLYQIHNVSLGEDISGALMALEEAKKEDKIRHIGVTSHSVKCLDMLINNPIFETIQYPYNIVENQAEELFEKASKMNIGIIVMKPLAGGAIDDAKLAIKYILNNDNVSVVIPGMESIKQIQENNSVKKGVYTQEELNKIDLIKNELNNDFCRRCGYCMPCPKGINIPFSFLVEGYFSRYNLKEWAVSRYQSMKVKPSACIECGICETKCPYDLPIRRKLKEVVKVLEEQNE